MIAFLFWLYSLVWDHIMPSFIRTSLLPTSLRRISKSPESEPIKMLYITSHDRHTPLSPPADLQYDLRCIPNPPKSTRETYTGMSHQIRDSLLCVPGFREILSEAQTEIQSAMYAMEKRVEGRREEMVVRVGCLCGSGHHRSVAFSELLAQMKWPEDWKLELSHRDLIPEVEREKALERIRRRI